MASSISLRLPLILIVSFLFLQINPSHSHACSPQKFSGNRVYANCSHLHELSSVLYWTYDSSNSSLKIAFVAAPAKTGGWVAWAINPKEPAMLGSQALIAYEDAGKMTVKTFDVTSYKIAPSKIAYEVSDMEAENANGTFTIFATIALPAKTTTINQVWQVGSAVENGIPAGHAMQKENLNSKGTLDLTTKAQTNAPAPAPSNATKSGVGDSIPRNRNGVSIFSFFAAILFIFA